LNQGEIKLNGHAIEARVYAENPQKNFMPSIGRIKTWRTPEADHDLRIDAGYRNGDNVSQYYDAMLAKVIAWAPTREGAIERLGRGLEETDVRGIVTNIPFLVALVTHPAVRANTIDTGFIERELQNLTAEKGEAGELELCAAVAVIVNEEQKSARKDAHSPWQTFGWMPVGRRQRVFSFRQGQGAEQRITMSYGGGPSTLSIDDRHYAFAISSSDEVGFDLTLNGIKSRVGVAVEGNDLYLRTRNGRFDLHWIDPFGGETEEQVSEDKIVAPLPGTVVALLAEEGATLEKGAPIIVLEVMKMEQTLRAPYAGVLKKLKCQVGDIVGEGVELAEVEPAAAS
jgi:3-methylcrotonyl-CoA carboxylase alpha subunit